MPRVKVNPEELKATDREKLIGLAEFFGSDYSHRGQTMIFEGRRYTFNRIGEIVRIQEIVRKRNGDHKYVLLAEDISMTEARKGKTA